MKNTLAERLATFLAAYQPFSEIPFEELVPVAATLQIRTLEKNQILFKVDDPLHPFFYIVASGAINLSVVADAEETLLNRCETGEILGLRPFFAKNNYMMTAKAREESIVYGIPIDTFRPLLLTNSKVLDFLLQSFASTAPRNSLSTMGKSGLVNDTVRGPEGSTELQYFQSLSYDKKPLFVEASDTVQVVAQQMTDNLKQSAVILHNNMLLGVVTEHDLSSKIATGRLPLTAACQLIASKNYVFVPENTSLAEAQLSIIRHNAPLLLVSADGTETTAITGVIHLSDLISAQANNPGLLIKEIKKALSVSELKDLREKMTDFIQLAIEKKVPLSHICAITGEVNMALIKRCIDLAILDYGSPPCRFAFLSTGSQGRKEQLLKTDQDHFLVYEDVAIDRVTAVREYFLRLSKRTTQFLSDIGYSECPNKHMANNLNWCKSFSDWIQQYSDWTSKPGLKNQENPGIFFDFELAAGEAKIEESLWEHVMSVVPKNKKFLAYLANEAIKRPPALGFFSKFNLEEDGEYKDLFDIKNRAILTYVEIARVIALSREIKGSTNTYSRFKQLAMLEPKHADVYQVASEAFLMLLKIRTNEGYKSGSDAAYIATDELSKSDRERLKSAILPLKELEEIVKSKFQLTFFS